MDKTDFGKFEKDENLFERKYAGVPYWENMRFLVCEGAASDRIEKEDTANREKRKQCEGMFILRTLLLAVKSRWNFHKISQCDVVCFSDASRSAPQSKFFDYWSMPPELKVLWIKGSLNPNDICFNDQHSLMWPYAMAMIRRYLDRLLGRTLTDREEHAFLKELEKKVRKRFGRSISAQRIEEGIQRWIPLDREFERYAEKLFDKVQCKAIVVVCYYQSQLFAISRVAKRRGIRVVELQHGVISNHEEYWFEDQRGVNNYTPDYFLCFGQQHIAWTKLLPQTKPIPIGFPYQEAQLKAVEQIKTENKTVIVYPNPNPAFEKVIQEFVPVAKAKGYRIVVKLHPSEATDPKLFYPVLANTSDVELITDQSKGIYYWLKLGKYHVMADTTVGLEALSFPHTVVCIAEHVPHLQTEPLLNWGVARGFTTAQQLLEIIESSYEQNLDVAAAKRQTLWQSDAKENMRKFFEKFVTEQNLEGER